MLSREAPLGRPDRAAARTLITGAAAIAAALLSSAAGGCGGDDESAPQGAETELTITLDRDGPGGEPAEEARIQCPGADAPPAACTAIADLPDDAAAPVPPAVACTQIYGGPDVVTLTGKLAGEQVDAELTRANGCEIDRFDRFAPLLEALFRDYEPGGATGP